MYKYLVALAFTAPVIFEAPAIRIDPTVSFDKYIASVTVAAVLLGVFLAALLKSSVKGVRRVALELAAIRCGQGCLAVQ